MKLSSSRIGFAGVLALVLATGVTAGSAAATSAPPGSTEPSTPPADTTPGCAEIVALLDIETTFATAYLNDDGELLASTLESLPDLTAAAEAAAPPDVAETVTLFVAPLADFDAIFEGVDLTDFDAVSATLSSIPPDEASDGAEVDLKAWASENCGWVGTDPFAAPVEPQECDVLDPAVAAEAAGIEVDVTDSDGGGDINLGSYWQKSCSYGNGTMTLSTISFNDLDEATRFFADNLVDSDGNPGEFIDVDLGGLPESTLVTNVSGFVSVTVLEATIPFAVAFSGDGIDPAAVVAAAEAIYTTLPAEPPPPPTTEMTDCCAEGTTVTETTAA